MSRFRQFTVASLVALLIISTGIVVGPALVLARQRPGQQQHEARAYVLERANILEECAKQLKAVLDGPQYKLCRCGRQITPTPVGTWKHVQKIPMSTQNHLARPA